MISPAQARRELLDTEHQLRHARNRLAAYELLDDAELVAPLRQVVTQLELVKATLSTRSQDVENKR